MNLKVRFKNPAFVITFATAIIAFIYQILGIVGVVPLVSQDQVVQLVTLAVNILVALGILVDPTTKGIADSDRAMNYDRPE